MPLPSDACRMACAADRDGCLPCAPPHSRWRDEDHLRQGRRLALGAGTYSLGGGEDMGGNVLATTVRFFWCFSLTHRRGPD